MTEREDKQRKETEAMIQAQHDEAKAERSEMEAQIAALKEELTPAPAVSDEQLTALQAWFEGLHATKLLADEVRVHSLVHTHACRETLVGLCSVLLSVYLSEIVSSDLALRCMLWSPHIAGAVRAGGYPH